jgi:hypothetical protein
MSKTIDLLKARKKDLEEQLKPFNAIRQELDEVNKALEALDPQCNGCYGGCNICRTGPYYR